MILAGRPDPLGATVEDHGTNFALFSAVAERVQLCLFDDHGRQTALHDLPECSDSIWHGFLPDCQAGQRYGFRVHGRYAQEDGLRCNPAKLLIDPYARVLDGEFAWDSSVFDYRGGGPDQRLTVNIDDSAPYVPKSVVAEPLDALNSLRPGTPWAESVFYELNVRGYTMQHPALDDLTRGRFDGMRNKEILGYLKALGITSVELMPVHAFIDEHHLAKKGLRNFWGYNSISFFAPASRYGNSDPVSEFRDMVRALHDAGLEVILDVVYNHTGEGDAFGPTLCFRGIDNLSYYSTEPGRPGVYINDTGCGNTLNADHVQVQALILDSLRYWHRQMGVDGFRFDLAPVLGRHNHGFSATHPLLDAITNDQQLRDAKLIAEPWDPGPGGYQLGEFPHSWAEWNDRYRDSVRRYWRGDHGAGAEFAARMRGSADIFGRSSRPPTASVNLVSSHDGFTLADVVSYEYRHNQANGEGNRDGHSHNYSSNFGVEGATDDAAINASRRLRRLNMLATLLVSQGTPMLLAGDEFSNSQLGNNNAYAQDNETGWLDWSGLQEDPAFMEKVRQLIGLRRATPLLHLPFYVHGSVESSDGVVQIQWLDTKGQQIADDAWSMVRKKNVLLTQTDASGRTSAVAILINGLDINCDFAVPRSWDVGAWRLAFSSSDATRLNGGVAQTPGQSITVLLSTDG